MPSVHSQCMVVVYCEYSLRFEDHIIHVRGHDGHIETLDALANFVKRSRTVVGSDMLAQALKQHEIWEIRAKGPGFEASQGGREPQEGHLM